MESLQQAKAELSNEVGRTEFVPRLADRVGVHAQASAVFGEPVERKGVTVIPVAKATWGFGGGSGGQGDRQGSGGGGGGFVSPLGFIEIRQNKAKFVRFRDLRLLAVGAGTAAAIIGFMFGRRL